MLLIPITCPIRQADSGNCELLGKEFTLAGTGVMVLFNKTFPE